MFKELANDIEGFRTPGHGDLSGWAKQGMLCPCALKLKIGLVALSIF